MQIDLESLRRPYTSLSDDELLALKRDELIEAAQKCYDEEVDRRGLDEAQESEAALDEQGYKQSSFGAGVDSNWLQDGACACSFVSQPRGFGSIRRREHARCVEGRRNSLPDFGRGGRFLDRRSAGTA